MLITITRNLKGGRIEARDKCVCTTTEPSSCMVDWRMFLISGGELIDRG